MHSANISRFFSVLPFFIFTAHFVAAVDKDAFYMSELLKALIPTPPGWSNTTHFCNWTGVICHQSSTRVHTISLPSTSLTGTLPQNLNTLSNLTHLDLHNNSLTGSLPVLSGLPYLQTVHLGHNNFTSIPNGCFKDLRALRILNIGNNLNLRPWIFPVDMDLSSSLQILDFEATCMVGSLRPEILDWFPSLETLFLSHNNLNGSLPDLLERSPIRYLRLNNQGNGSTLNSLTGTIKVLSSMRFLSQAWLNNNYFTGLIPDMSNCTHLLDLQLHSNALSGLVPPSLMALTHLKKVSLGNNMLQGPIPFFRGNNDLNVRANWEGNNFCQADLGPCDPRVMALLEIAADFGLPGAVEFEWSGNDPCSNWSFVGCKSGKIVKVDMGNHGFGGTISPGFSNLKDLVNLTLYGNNLTGSIPHSLTTLPQLELLDLSNNNLTGLIPNFPHKLKLIAKGNALLGKEIVSADNALNGGGPSNKRNATSPLRPLWIAGASMFSVGVVILIVIICKRNRYLDFAQKRIFKKTRTHLADNVQDFIKSYNLSVAKQYSYGEVKKITNSFRDKLGHGGYGVVYKGILPDGRQVAVKVINESKGDGEEFINEVASISKTLHVNIVLLLGFCYEMDKRALIYEFMPNGSLDKFIYRNGFESTICSLDWNTLYQIAIGIARGLEYLHQGCISRILHLDIKPQNILLDEEFAPKISDFGLAKICQKKDSIISILGTRGTIGFIAPEVFSRTFGGVSHKSDVYSYGMLILEMIGGRKNYDTGESNTTEMYFSNWINKDLELSGSLANGLAISEEEKDMVRKITKVSLWCIQTNPLDRPSMSKVIEMLQGSLQSIPYPPKPVLYSSQSS